MFRFALTDRLKIKLAKLSQKDAKRAEIINKKIKQIIACDDTSINHYKNLRHDLKELKRVHIDNSFVLTFHVNIKDNFIIFENFDHHDRIYK
jgi:mRNA interferase RelE/StbE/toxin YoeB